MIIYALLYIYCLRYPQKVISSFTSNQDEKLNISLGTSTNITKLMILIASIMMLVIMMKIVKMILIVVKVMMKFIAIIVVL